MRLSVLIPVFNEGETLEQILEKVFEQDFLEVIIVDDGSTDRTKEILKNIKHKKVKIITHPKNLGKGAAVQTALRAVKGDYILIQDADLEYDPKYYPKLTKLAGPKTVVYGSRMLTNSLDSFKKIYYGNKLVTWFNNLLFSTKLTDTYTGYKLLPTNLARELDLKSNGFEIEAEITGKLNKKKVKIIEVPITLKPRSYQEGKKIKTIDAFIGMYTFLKIRFPIFNKINFLLLLILAIGLFFRSYAIVSRFGFAHDADLYSWIVKDIVINHHWRLIGQLTTAKGIFIGPLFYYSLIPFFLLTKMDPIGSLIPITILSTVTVLSFYIVFAKLYNKTVGLIASFFDATLLTIIQLDRNVVPSTPTYLWSIWYFYCLVNISRGNYSVLWILGLLIALIWNIHIALVPTLLAVPVAIIVSKKMPSLKQIIIFAAVAFVFSLPLIVFEFKHGFSQTFSLIHNLQVNQGGGVGFKKFQLLSLKATLNMISLFFAPQNPLFLKDTPLIATILLSALLLVRKKLLTLRELLPLYAWIVGVFIFYTFSSTIISEYYLSNYEIIFIAIISFWIYVLYRSSKVGKVLTLVFLAIILFKNLFFFVSENYYHKGYIERKAVASYITEDSQRKGFPCVSVSYITAPGENVGFRYFFFLDNLHVNQPKSGSPVYTIVLPDELAQGQNSIKFGHIKIIPPDQVATKEAIEKSCSGENSNLTDSMFGYTQ